MIATKILAAVVGGLLTALAMQFAAFQISNPIHTWILWVFRIAGMVLGSMAAWELAGRWL